MKNLLLFVLVIVFSSESFASGCEPIEGNRVIELSDVVFRGKLLSSEAVTAEDAKICSYCNDPSVPPPRIKTSALETEYYYKNQFSILERIKPENSAEKLPKKILVYDYRKPEGETGDEFLIFASEHISDNKKHIYFGHLRCLPRFNVTELKEIKDERQHPGYLTIYTTLFAVEMYLNSSPLSASNNFIEKYGRQPLRNTQFFMEKAKYFESIEDYKALKEEYEAIMERYADIANSQKGAPWPVNRSECIKYSSSKNALPDFLKTGDVNRGILRSLEGILKKYIETLNKLDERDMAETVQCIMK